MQNVSTRCPYCFGRMQVRTLLCKECGTEVTGQFGAPRFLELSPEQQRFATEFILAGGSLKEMASRLGVSYPTVRARLDRIIESLQGKKSPEEERRAAVLDAVEEKRISTHEASELLSEGQEDQNVGKEEQGNG